jgi:hypothetical protein
VSKRYYKAFTYKPKIPAVWDGRCSQTIRYIPLPDHNHATLTLAKEKAIKVGDEIVWFQWSGRPYHSKWINRLLTEITEVQIIKIYKEGIVFEPLDRGDGAIHSWTHKLVNELAQKDNILGRDFSFGLGMRDLFYEKYRLSGYTGIDVHPDMKKWFQIIRWGGSKIRSVA